MFVNNKNSKEKCYYYQAILRVSAPESKIQNIQRSIEKRLRQISILYRPMLNHFASSHLSSTVSNSTQCVLQKATPSEIQSQGTIKEIKKGLYTGHLVNANGDVVYFGSEKLSYRSIEYWSNHICWMRINLKLMLHLIEEYRQLPGYSCTQVEINQRINTLMERYTVFNTMHYAGDVMQKIMKIAQQTPGSLEKLHLKLLEAEEAIKGVHLDDTCQKLQKHICYVSSEPITDYQSNAFKKKHFTHYDEYLLRNKNLILTVGNRIFEGVSEHRGISKNPFALLQSVSSTFKFQETKVPLSMALHFFMMTARKNHAEFMTVSPMTSMRRIMDDVIMKTGVKACFARDREQISQRGWQDKIMTVANSEIPYVVKLSEIVPPLWRGTA